MKRIIFAAVMILMMAWNASALNDSIEIDHNGVATYYTIERLTDVHAYLDCSDNTFKARASLINDQCTAGMNAMPNGHATEVARADSPAWLPGWYVIRLYDANGLIGAARVWIKQDGKIDPNRH